MKVSREEIKEFRAFLGMTCHSLGYRLGVCGQQVSGVETGNKKISKRLNDKYLELFETFGFKGWGEK